MNCDNCDKPDLTRNLTRQTRQAGRDNLWEPLKLAGYFGENINKFDVFNMKTKPKKKRRIYLGKKEKEILELIKTGILVSSVLVAPNLPSALRHKKKKYIYQRSFNHLYEKNLIILSGEKVYLSEKGQKLLDRIESEEIEIKKHEWDGIWRIVAYDIPEDSKKERDYFKRKLKDLGFEELQKSMLVIPYKCKEEIAVIAQNLGISPFVMHLITDRLPRQEEMIKRFGLEGAI